MLRWNGFEVRDDRIGVRSEGGLVVTVDCERVLCVAGFDEVQFAHRAFRSLMEESTGASSIEIAVLISRARDGRADVVEARSGGRSDEPMDVLTPLVMGLLAPPLILSRAIEDGFGDVIKRLTKLHDTGEVGVPVASHFPRNSSAIAALSCVPVSRNAIELLGRVERSTMVELDGHDVRELKLAIARSLARPRHRVSTASM